MDRWEILGIVAAIFNPLPTGILAAYFLWKEGYGRTSKIVAGICAAVIMVGFFLAATMPTA